MRDHPLLARIGFVIIICVCSRLKVSLADSNAPQQVKPAAAGLLATEKLAGDGIWVHPSFEKQTGPQALRVKVWFDEQFLGDGTGYLRRSKEFAKAKRRELRSSVVKTLKALSDKSYQAANKHLQKLTDDRKISNVQRHWIVNGFTCTMSPDALDDLKSVPGVKKVFLAGRAAQRAVPRIAAQNVPAFKPVDKLKFDPARYKHPWYIRYLQADKVWQKFGISGQNTLNVIHDFNFVFSDNVTRNLYRNPDEVPGNGKDDDANGLVDDYHGYNFANNSAQLTMRPVPGNAVNPRLMHGYMCAAIVCASGAEGKPLEFGIAPEGSWAGVIAGNRLEAAVEWAVEHNADTYSMSFSMPGLGEYRSHWRKVMEHGSYCGIYFVSGAGNFGQKGSRSFAPVPVQMRTPENIPEVVFAAAGIQRNFSQTPFSSRGPVEWKTEHYQDGRVQKPEVCAFNMGLPLLKRDGTALPVAINGNSFAGPMFCGSIALMLSADPDLLPWDLKQIITTTATDVSKPGVDDETGHGLINCYRAVKEVLRRKAIRDGTDPKPYAGREPGDTLDIAAIQKKLKSPRFKVAQVQPGSQAAKLGVKAGDVFISYNGEKITTRQSMLAAKRKVTVAKTQKIPVVIKRGGETIELGFGRGPLGVVPSIEFDDPTFN